MSDMSDRAKSRVPDRIQSPRDVLGLKPGSALKMERATPSTARRLADVPA